MAMSDGCRQVAELLATSRWLTGEADAIWPQMETTSDLRDCLIEGLTDAAASAEKWLPSSVRFWISGSSR